MDPDRFSRNKFFSVRNPVWRERTAEMKSAYFSCQKLRVSSKYEEQKFPSKKSHLLPPPVEKVLPQALNVDFLKNLTTDIFERHLIRRAVSAAF